MSSFRFFPPTKSFQLYNLLVTRPLGVWNGVHCLNSHPGRICIRVTRRAVAKLGIAILTSDPGEATPPLSLSKSIRRHQYFISFNEVKIARSLYIYIFFGEFTDFWEEMHHQVQLCCLYLLVFVFSLVSCQPGKMGDPFISMHCNGKRRKSSGCFSGVWRPLRGPANSFHLPLSPCPPSRQGHPTECVPLSTSDFQT